MVKKLYRSKEDRVISGVCGGIGEYYNIDPNVIRVIFGAGLLFVGTTFLVYLLMLLIIPNSPN